MSRDRIGPIFCSVVKSKGDLYIPELLRRSKLKAIQQEKHHQTPEDRQSHHKTYWTSIIHNYDDDDDADRHSE
jgi:hypothetical protein